MPLFNESLWGDTLPGETSGSAASNIEVNQVVDGILPDLHATSRDDLMFWTEGQLIEWMDEALKRLARRAGVFIGRWASTLTVPAQSAYALPDRHISTRHVSYLATPLRPANQSELEALNSAYRTAAGTPSKWYQDQLSEQVALYPVPDAAQAMPMIYEGWPEPVTYQPYVAAPAPIKGYLAMSALAKAYGAEGQAEAHDIAAHCQARVEMYEELMASYYGGGV